MPHAPSAAEAAAVDAVLAAHGVERGSPRRDLLLPALHAVMDAVGWVSRGALNHVSEALHVPPAEAYGVATFYAMFSTHQRAPRVAHVCDDVACAPFGGEELCAAMEERLGPAGSGTDRTWVRSPCLGMCERAPAVLLQRAAPPDGGAPATNGHAPNGTGAHTVLHASDDPTHDQLAPATVDDVLDGLDGRRMPDRAPGASVPQAGDDRRAGLKLLSRVGSTDPTDLDSYRAAGGYAALRRALAAGPERVLREVTDAALTGRGGAAFPTGTKWTAVAQSAVRPKYLICNADESEPGTFKDRVLLEGDPYSLVEAMTVAGFAVGAEHGYLYVRGEYPVATRRLEQAIAGARSRGLLGDDVLGSGVRFDLELRRGAGAYICGEETALMESIEGRRGEPRNKPPFPTVSGLFGKPTVINNVETLVNVLEVLREGGPAFASVGSGRSTGTKLFCVSGVIDRPGVYELPMGATLRELLEEAGGVPPGLRSILLGGAAGSFVTPDQLDVPLTLEGTREIGASLGSGVVLCLDDSVDMGVVLTRIAAFFRDESCGQCVPCRVGTVRQEESLARLVRGTSDRATEMALLDDLSRVMVDASICGLGQTASVAVRSALSLDLLEDRS